MLIKLNLASRTYVHRPKLYLGYALLCGALFVLFGLQGYDFFHWRQQKSTLDDQIHQFEVQLGQRTGDGVSTEELRELATKLKFANEVLADDSYRWTALMGHLEEVVGPGVRVSSLVPDFRDNALRLTGQARTLADLRTFLETLSRSEGFTDHFLLNQQKAEVEVKGVTRVLINFSLVIRGALT